jgi:hypothetical protein
MKGKNRITNKFQMDFKNVNCSSGNVAERISKSMQFFFLKIVKLSPQSRFKVFFRMRCL